MADERLKEAESLFKAKLYNGANYLGGYAAEFALKAAICTRLMIDLFDESEVNPKTSAPLKVHHLETLLIYAGLFKQLKTDRNTDEKLDKAWSIVSSWKEDRRYEAAPCKPETARRFLNAITTFLSWARNHW